MELHCIFKANSSTLAREQRLRHFCYELLMRELVRHLMGVASQMFILITTHYFQKAQTYTAAYLFCDVHPAIFLSTHYNSTNHNPWSTSPTPFFQDKQVKLTFLSDICKQTAKQSSADMVARWRMTTRWRMSAMEQ